MTDFSANRRIFALLLFVVALWGINVVMIKYLTRYYPPLALAPIRLLLAAGLLMPAVVMRYGWVRPPRDVWLPIGGVALFAIFLHHITMTWGIATTSGTHAALILGLNPLLTTLLAGRLADEPFNWGQGTGILLGFAAVALVVSGKASGGATLAGDFAMGLSMAAAVLGYLFVKKSTAVVTPLVVTAYSHAIASVSMGLFGLFANPVWYYPGALELGPVAVLLFSSLVNTGLGALWWNTGIQRIGASRSSLFQNGIPVAGVFASALLLGEELLWEHLASLVLVVLGVSFGTGLIRL